MFQDITFGKNRVGAVILFMTVFV